MNDIEKINADLKRLSDDNGCGYIYIKFLAPDSFIATYKFMFTVAIIKGKISNIHLCYDDRWCYHSMDDAKKAFDKWDGKGEPIGWHRHPATGRRRPHGDEDLEYINL